MVIRSSPLRCDLQIKPLTEEEKKEKLAELKTHMAEKRAKKAAEEAKEARANEEIRRKSGKVCGPQTSVVEGADA